MDEKDIRKALEGKTDFGCVYDILKACEFEEDFKNFYCAYFGFMEQKINKENDIKPGDTRAIGEIYTRVWSNLIRLVDELPDMRGEYAQKVFWFLYARE
jgi:hypothetical protein